MADYDWNKPAKIDPQNAKDFTKGAQQPQTLAEGWSNLKKAFGSSDDSGGGDQLAAMKRRKDSQSGT